MDADDDPIVELLRSEGPFQRDRLAFGAFVGSRYPYLYMETPKSACTTTKRHLWGLEGLGPVPYLSRVHERPQDDPRLSLLTVPEAQAVEAMRGASIFRFCVWRDPVRRLVSTFSDRIRRSSESESEWRFWKELVVKLCGLESIAQITFDHFVRVVRALPDHQRDTHFMSQWRLTLADFITYDRVVRLDHYADDMAEVFRTLGVPRSDWPELGLRENRSESEAVEVSAATADLIRATFQKDYELFERDCPAAASG